MTDENKPNSKIDPETGLPLTKAGNLSESSGCGALQKIKLHPPAEMEYMVENGLAPSALPNWNREDPESLWYVGYRKFSPERREIYLTKLAQTGRVQQACLWAGVSKGTVLKHREQDPEFDAACKMAYDMYHENVVTRLTHQALEGQIDIRKDKEGNVISKRVSYEQQLRIRLLQRADPDYRDASRQEVSVVGGAVVVPAPIDSVESWDDVVRRHTASPTAGPAVVGTHSERGLPSEHRPDVGSKALSDGRVIKRTTLDAEGSEVKENEHKEE